MQSAPRILFTTLATLPRARPKNISFDACRNPILNSFQRPLQVLHGIRDAESQITLSEFPKRRSRKARHARFFKQRIGQELRLTTGGRHLGEHIKRAMWHATRKSFDAVEPSHEHISAALEFQTHEI